MIASTRPPALPARLRSALGRRLTLAAVVPSLAVALLWLGAPPAGAVIEGNFGVQPRAQATVIAAPLQYHKGPVLHSSDSYAIYWDPAGAYRGDWKRLIDRYFHDVGAASKSLGDVFAVDTQYSDSGGQAANESTFRGAYTDEDAYPTTENGGNCTEPAVLACLTDQQIQAELKHVISTGALPGATGPAVYYLLTPPGVTVCTDSGGSGNCSDSTAPSGSPPNGICGYHSVINPGTENPSLYAVQPWVAGDAGLYILSQEPLTTSGFTADALACQANAAPLREPNALTELNPFGNYAQGLADVIINDLSVEQNNIVTDPYFNGWYQTATSAEQSDMCQWALGLPPEQTLTENAKTHSVPLVDETINGDSYDLQWAFSSTGIISGKIYSCWAGVDLEPHFTAPNPVNVNDVVSFDATESLITLAASAKNLTPEEPFALPVYSWNFGDGTSVSGANDASVFHSYQQGGSYEVSLTVTDSGGNVSQPFTKLITVVGGSPPEKGFTGPHESISPPTGPSTGTGTGSSSSSSSVAPVASASVLSRSLRSVSHGGLVVRYSVNERVAGRLEVLVDSSVARRLGLHGPRGVGFAAGAPAQTVIGRLIVVTTKGGRSTVRVKFDKHNAAALRRLHKLSVMVRLLVRNASARSATVLTLATLSR